jgi:hypothetical protein
VKRLIEFVETTTSYKDRRLLARVLADVVTRGEPALRASLEDKVSMLRSIR